MSPVGVELPEFIIPARKRPSVFPLLAKIWKKTDEEPALSPQLTPRFSLRPCLASTQTAYMVTFVGSPPKDPMNFCTQRRAVRSAAASIPPCFQSEEDTVRTILETEVTESSFLDLSTSQEPEGVETTERA